MLFGRGLQFRSSLYGLWVLGIDFNGEGDFGSVNGIGFCYIYGCVLAKIDLNRIGFVSGILRDLLSVISQSHRMTILVNHEELLQIRSGIKTVTHDSVLKWDLTKLRS